MNRSKVHVHIADNLKVGGPEDKSQRQEDVH